MSLVDKVLNGIYGFVMFWYTVLMSFVGLFISSPKKSISGELTLVTGAGHGIGRELALELSRHGAVLVLVDVNKENNERVAEEIRLAGGKAYSYTCDITDASKVFSLADQVRKEVGDVSILWNNAGILNGGKLLDMSEKAIRRTFEVNTISHCWTVQAFLPAMLKKGKGHVISTVSMAAFTGTAMLVDYCASKFGALGFAEALREELVALGYPKIQVSCLCPYFVSTGLVQNYVDTLGNTVTAKETAKVGVDGILRNEEVVFVPRKMWLGLKLMKTWPRATAQFMYRRTGVKVVPQYKKED